MSYNTNTVFQPGTGKSGTARVWNPGPPPHIGWWNASSQRNMGAWRWWDGNSWSWAALSADSAGRAAGYVDIKVDDASGIAWTDYWPENARVPRVDPSLRENRAIVEFINISITSPDPKLWEEAAWKDYHCKHAPAAAGSTRTVREMKERVRCPEAPRFIPLDKPTKEEWNKWAQTADKLPTFEEVVAPRLSESVRVNDVDFSGAMKRNTDPNVDRRCRDKDPTCFSGARMRSNGQAYLEAHEKLHKSSIPDSRELSAAPTRELVRELFRRLG